MTAQILAWPLRQRPARIAWSERAVFAVSVLILLVFAQPWSAFMPAQQVSDVGSSIARIMFFPTYALGLGLVSLRPGAAMRGLAGQPFLVLLLCVAAASTAWSVAPGETSRRVVAIVLTTFCGVALGSRWRWQALAEVFAAAFAILSIVSLVLAVAVPGVGRMGQPFPGAWRGVWMEKNALGGMMAFGCLI